MLEKSDGVLRMGEYLVYVSRTAPILATSKLQTYIITNIISISHIKKTVLHVVQIVIAIGGTFHFNYVTVTSSCLKYMK